LALGWTILKLGSKGLLPQNEQS